MDDKTLKVRFAPSPTGKLHMGNVRTAVINWLYARNHGGIFLLRMDDTDRERSTKEFEEGIKKDLKWLELDWDEYAQQSWRQDCYDLAAERLKANGRLYPCYETSEELGLMRKSLLNRGLPPIYNRYALELTAEQIAAFEKEGRRPHWRFKLQAGSIFWMDMVRGSVSFEAGNLSDPVLIREDGRPLYTLTSVVDDLELGVTDVIRGEDHVANTAVQVQLFESLGGPVPEFGHVPLVSDMGGEKLSKRLGSLTVEHMRKVEHFEPLAINVFLSKLGTSDGAVPVSSLDTLVEEFNISHYGRSAPRMDIGELRTLNSKLLMTLDFSTVRERLPGLDEAKWHVVRGNISSLAEALEWEPVISGRIEPVIYPENRGFIREAAVELPEGELNENSWLHWTEALKKRTGRKGKMLFMPLRQALTGRDKGPEMAVILPLLGRELVLERLDAVKS